MVFETMLPSSLFRAFSYCSMGGHSVFFTKSNFLIQRRLFWSNRDLQTKPIISSFYITSMTTTLTTHRNWKEMRSLGVVLLIALVAFVLNLIIFQLIWPINITAGRAETIFTSTLSLSGILIAVIGILLSIYVSQGIAKTDHKMHFQQLIAVLTLSVIVSFITSLLSLYLIANPGCDKLSTVISNLFCSLIIINIVAIIATVKKIMW